ncbi:hypothetical protein B0I37DRAFT_354389 [Chaetomium sp. MPI-CAGE-AT-0009]|nr:hypothetical protein B0I37DRAFT_354389 [Chaetomium sp. MPI-CAGE-AT-0009]
MLARREGEEKDCHPQPDLDFCKKPWVSSNKVTWIIVGVVLGLFLVSTGSVVLFFHFRRRKREKGEDVEDRFHRADYGLDELPVAGKPRPDHDMRSQDRSPSGYGRRSRDPLQVGSEPKYPPPSQLNGHLSAFDDAASSKSGNGSSYPPSVNPAWPKREGSQLKPLEN